MTPFETLASATERERNDLLGLPILADVANGRFTIDTYLRFLTNAYHHVRFTVPLMMTCGAHLDPHQDWLMEKLKTYVDEEFGHEQWILNDIRAAGGDAEGIARSEPNPPTELLVAYVRDYIVQTNAVGFFGMVFVLEGTSTTLALGTARLIQEGLSLPDAAFSYLTSHGELDQEHMRYFEELVDRLTPGDLQHVIHVARRAYRLYADVLASVSGAEILDAA